MDEQRLANELKQMLDVAPPDLDLRTGVKDRIARRRALAVAFELANSMAFVAAAGGALSSVYPLLARHLPSAQGMTFLAWLPLLIVAGLLAISIKEILDAMARP